MTPTEIKFILYIVSALLAIIAFIGVLFINAFLKMAKDISEIKTAIQVQSTKHDSLEKRVETLEDRI